MNTKIMGILNITPDSCYDGGKYEHFEAAVSRGIEIEKEGADLLDIGGESTRPGASEISEEEELRRVLPALKALSNKINIPISIDTMKPKVAEKAIAAGASIINDVSGFKDRDMILLAKETCVQICVMHMQKTPKTMQDNPFYPEGIVQHLLGWFKERIDTLTAAGIAPEKIILDPGIGFGKTVADNLKILQNVPTFKKLGFPLLLGISRKFFLTKICNKPRSDVLQATIALNTLAAIAGTDFIRVHDVKEHKEAFNVV